MAGIILGEGPIRHPDCCLTLSSALLNSLTATLDERGSGASCKFVLSVGSGSGLLESLLLEQWKATHRPDLFIEGVEVQQSGKFSSLNKYLPEQHHSSVKGTWELSPRALSAAALMFVYPRSPDLVERYLQTCLQPKDAKLEAVIWLGPKCDWPEFERCFTAIAGWRTSVVPDADSGLLEYEMMAVVKT